ncbi:hypothetical protein AC579_2609 [Pseudocercospora musae]|uniref:Uncharacterized protein n=1 Tax=Pseudocercospora musae TaxID=113226 RepID=A0A139I1I7_9PEZI|nr:hypothetical protein AC579_2609 [Pseudocercospora musae]
MIRALVVYREPTEYYALQKRLNSGDIEAATGIKWLRLCDLRVGGAAFVGGVEPTKSKTSDFGQSRKQLQLQYLESSTSSGSQVPASGESCMLVWHSGVCLYSVVRLTTDCESLSFVGTALQTRISASSDSSSTRLSAPLSGMSV